MNVLGVLQKKNASFQLFARTVLSSYDFCSFQVLILFTDHNLYNYSCGLSTATIEYSSLCVCVAV